MVCVLKIRFCNIDGEGRQGQVVRRRRRGANRAMERGVLVQTSMRDRMVPNAHCTDPLQEGSTIRGGSIPHEISRCVVPREPLGDLARDGSSQDVGGTDAGHHAGHQGAIRSAT
jgi:hypothetical protein